MTPEQFVYWLQGFAEIEQSAPTKKQWELVEQLNLLFDRKTYASSRE